jgi:hypothetical protein
MIPQSQHLTQRRRFPMFRPRRLDGRGMVSQRNGCGTPSHVNERGYDGVSARWTRPIPQVDSPQMDSPQMDSPQMDESTTAQRKTLPSWARVATTAQHHSAAQQHES